jgi:hypothetical protein
VGTFDEHRQGDSRLHFLEDLLVHAVGEPFALVAVKIEDPDLVEAPEEEVPDCAMELALQVRAVRDEREDPVPDCPRLFQELPDRPANEPQVVVPKRPGVLLRETLSVDPIEVLE